LSDAGAPRPAGGWPRGLRCRFTKHGKVRFTSQRDVARMWERALRRSGLPVAWSEGFSPRPLLSFGLALPTGCESDAEYVDVRLEGEGGDVAPAQGTAVAEAALAPLVQLLTSLLPDGVDVAAVVALSGDTQSLQQQVTSCTWELEVQGVTARDLATRVEHLLGAASVPIRRERKGKLVDDDLRPGILALAPFERAPTGPPNQTVTGHLRADLATQPRGIRPMELLEGLGTDLVLVRACRTHQWIEHEGTRREPVPDEAAVRPAARAPHATERAT